MGPSWGRLGAILAVMELCWAVFGAFLGRLGVFWGPSWGRLGAVLGRLGDVWGRLAASWGIWGPSWSVLGAVFGFWSDLPSENRSPNLEKSLNFIGKPLFLAFRRFPHKIASRSDFGANLALFWFPKRIKIASWRRLEASWGHLEASWSVLGSSRGVKECMDRRKTSGERPECRPGAS